MIWGYQEFTTKEYFFHCMSIVLEMIIKKTRYRIGVFISLNSFCIKHWLPGWIRYCDKHNRPDWY